MCLFFKKKPKKIIPENAKFSVGQLVHFRHRGELYFGFIYEIHYNPLGKIIYDIQVGGQCPAIIKEIPEEIIFIKK